MTYSDVPFDAAAADMLTIGEAMEELSGTEPLVPAVFRIGTPDTEVRYEKGWWEGGLTSPAPVWLRAPGLPGWVQLTHQAAKQVGSTARIPQKLQEFWPPALLAGAVNYALREGFGDRELKLLCAGTGKDQDGGEVPLGVAQVRAPLVPFSNVALLETVLAAIRDKLGDEAADSAAVDFKFWHDLEHTSVRVVLPVVQQVLTGTGTDGDGWCYGIEFCNSLIGSKQTTAAGYLFRFASLSGARDVSHMVGGLNRRGTPPAAAYEWMADSTKIILSDLAPAFEQVQTLTERKLDKDVRVVLSQLFRENSVPKDQQERVTDAVTREANELSMYWLMNAVASAANIDDLGWRPAVALMALAGEIAHAGGGMCDGSLPHGCRRLLPADWEDPSAG